MVQIGSIFGALVSGALLSAYDGWGSVFYFFGGISFVWIAIFVCFKKNYICNFVINLESLKALICYKDPESHPFVSDKEKEHLRKELGQLERDKNIKSVPWRQILTSPAIIALIFAQVKFDYVKIESWYKTNGFYQLGHNWGFFIMVTDLPKYMNDVLKFSIKENGFYNALPFLAMWIVAQLTGFLSDFMITKGIMSITNVRKFFTIFGKSCMSFLDIEE